MFTENWIIYSATIMTLLLQINGDILNPPACEIFCRGKMLQIIQHGEVFSEPKSFIDMTMKMSIQKTLDFFYKFMKNTRGIPTKIQVKDFINRFFHLPGSDFTREEPKDWVSKPKFVTHIKDKRLREWALNVVSMWKNLGRRVNRDVLNNTDRYTILYVPNLVIIPDGRSKEYYYWDSYWIILGLLRSEMYETVKGMIINFLYLTKTYGFVPNAGRIYHLTRSTLPLLIPMVNEYYKVTKDKDFIKNNIDVLEKEFDFWLKNRLVKVVVKGKHINLARYNVKGNEPRPEGYRYDVIAARSIKSKKGKAELFRNIIAACESGWDFSSRWFKHVTGGNISDTKTSSIAPVDLNAVLCWNARILAEFYKMIEMPVKASTYNNISFEFKKIVSDLMWDEEDGIWYDYDIRSRQKRKHFFASNVVPLWAGCYNMKRKNRIGFKVAKYLKKLKVDRFSGGVPSSFVNTDLRWDFPNAIPPMQHVIITGLRLTKNKDAMDLAFQLADKWIQSTYAGYISERAMFDKYDAEQIGKYGKDIQGVVRIGYGWTNAIVLELLHYYGKDIHQNLISGAFHQTLSPILLRITIVTLIFYRRTIVPCFLLV